MIQVGNVSRRYHVLKSGALQIARADERDVGEYTCRGDNHLGNVEQTTTIQLLSKFYVVFIRVVHTLIYELKGDFII